MYVVARILLLNTLIHICWIDLAEGAWGDWSAWGQCSEPCGGGVRSRTRVCDSSAPELGDAVCTSDGSSAGETESCNPETCPRKQQL